MKIETFVKGSVVVVIFFVLGLTLMGEGILQQKWGVASAPTFSNVSSYDKNIYSIQEEAEEESLAKDTDPAQVDPIQDATDISWYAYTIKSLKVVQYTVKAPDSNRGAISEVLSYLYVNPMIIGGIISVMIFSFIFALVAWWKSRRV